MERYDELYDPILVVGRWLVSGEHCSSCKHVLAMATAARSHSDTAGAFLLLVIMGMNCLFQADFISFTLYFKLLPCLALCDG